MANTDEVTRNLQNNGIKDRGKSLREAVNHLTSSEVNGNSLINVRELDDRVKDALMQLRRIDPNDSKSTAENKMRFVENAAVKLEEEGVYDFTRSTGAKLKNNLNIPKF